ncbi:MAG: GxxExxY protein [Limisphaerales bacterium]
MSDLLYKNETFKIIGLCMEVHRELGKGHDEVIYEDALEIECQRNKLPCTRERKHEIEYKGIILPHFYNSDFIMFDKILFEGKACECLCDAHVKQVLNYLAASKLQLALLVNFGEDSLTWKRIIPTETPVIESIDLKNLRQSAKSA